MNGMNSDNDEAYKRFLAFLASSPNDDMDLKEEDEKEEEE